MSIALQALVALGVSLGALFATSGMFHSGASAGATVNPPASTVTTDASASADAALDAHTDGGISVGL